MNLPAFVLRWCFLMSGEEHEAVVRRDEEHRSRGDADMWVPCRIWKIPRAWTGAWAPQLVQAAPSQGCWLCQPTCRAPPALRPKGPKPLTRGDWNILAFSSLLSLEGNIRSLRHWVVPAGFVLMLQMFLGSRGLASWGHTALCASWKSGLDPLT